MASDHRKAKAYLQDYRRRDNGKKKQWLPQRSDRTTKKNPEFQVEYLKASLEENSDMPEAILVALRDIAEARGFEQLAEAADLSKKSLYKILSDTKDAKPRFETIVKLLNALGLRLTVEESPHAS